MYPDRKTRKQVSPLFLHWRYSTMHKPRIIFFDIDGTEPDLDDYFAVAKSTVPVSPDFDAMAFGDGNGLI